MDINVKNFLFGNKKGQRPAVRMEFQLFEKDNGELFIAYVAVGDDKQKAGTATVKREKVKEFMVEKMTRLCEKMI